MVGVPRKQRKVNGMGSCRILVQKRVGRAATIVSRTRNLRAFNRRYYLQSGLSQCAVYNKTTAHGGLAHFSSFTQPKPSKGVY